MVLMVRFRSRELFRKPLEEAMSSQDPNIPSDGIQKLKSLTPELSRLLYAHGAVTLAQALDVIRNLESHDKSVLPEGITAGVLKDIREEIQSFLTESAAKKSGDRKTPRWTDIRPLGIPGPPDRSDSSGDIRSNEKDDAPNKRTKCDADTDDEAG